MVFTDMVGFTALKKKLGSPKAMGIIRQHHQIIRDILADFEDAEKVDCQGDAFFLVFDRLSDAARFCLVAQAQLRDFGKTTPEPIADRMGFHFGDVLLEEAGSPGKPRDYFGLEVDTCARVMSLAQGNQILATRGAFDSAKQILTGEKMEGVEPLEWKHHGLYIFKGVDEPMEVCEAGESGRACLSPPPDSDKGFRYEPEKNEPESWRSRVLRTRWLMGAVGAVVSVLLGWLFLVSPFDFGLKGLSYDLPFAFRSPTAVDEAVIVHLDEEAYDRLRQSPFQPWDRSLHTRLLGRLTDLGAKAVIFDIVWDQPWPDRSVDEKLAEAINGPSTQEMERTHLGMAGVLIPSQGDKQRYVQARANWPTFQTTIWQSVSWARDGRIEFHAHELDSPAKELG